MNVESPRVLVSPRKALENITNTVATSSRPILIELGPGLHSEEINKLIQNQPRFNSGAPNIIEVSRPAVLAAAGVSSEPETAQSSAGVTAPGVSSQSGTTSQFPTVDAAASVSSQPETTRFPAVDAAASVSSEPESAQFPTVDAVASVSSEPESVQSSITGTSTPTRQSENSQAAAPTATPIIRRLPREENALHQLFQNYDGHMLLKAYEEDKASRRACLENGSRAPPSENFDYSKYAGIVLKHLIYQNGFNYSLGDETMTKYAILSMHYLEPDVELNEKEELDLLSEWYIRGYREGTSPVSAKGHLPNALRNITREARKRYGKVGRQPRNSTSTSPNTSMRQVNGNIDEDFIKDWIADSKARYKEALTMTIGEIYEKYDDYAEPNGYKLILADYGNVFPESASALTSKWPSIANKIIQIAELYRVKGNSIDEILAMNPERKTNAHVQNLALALISPLLVSFAKTKKTIGRTWRPNEEEISSSFLLQVPELGELAKKRQDLEDMMSLHKEPIQPYAIMCGPLHSAQLSFAVVNGTMYSMGSPLEAIDFCFKTTTVLRTPFCKVSFDSWKFLAKLVYQTNDKNVNNNVIKLKNLVLDSS
ncbi:hypothetical protein QAD02_014186 [Eretmocerus hayati]|uniref:Uncharacterized protein n=1 Tax=Eretmocerus hayati TaxID=131215 RepID=A0ACC2P479_9HYME|nr:hypothetical protein QAD02_014186 [Eretmocerus hayati]